MTSDAQYKIVIRTLLHFTYLLTYLLSDLALGLKNHWPWHQSSLVLALALKFWHTDQVG